MNINDLIEQELKKNKPISAFVIDVMREAIMRGFFQQGRILRQVEMASLFEVSHIPIREALRQLEAEGFVQKIPELLSNLVYGVSSGVPVWLIFIPNAVFENDAFDNFADKIETLDTLPPLFS